MVRRSKQTVRRKDSEFFMKIPPFCNHNLVKGEGIKWPYISIIAHESKNVNSNYAYFQGLARVIDLTF